MPGVVTLTAAPSIDRSYFLDQLIPGSVHRAHTVTEEFAGKGVNVSHGLALAETPTMAVVPLPKKEWETRQGHPWLLFSDASVSPRVSITVLEPDGRTTKINQGAPPLTPADWTRFVELAEHTVSAHQPQWLALCGALPKLTTGEDIDIEQLASLAHAGNSLFALDTSGPLLATWARRGAPDLIKPNADELAECVGRNLTTVADVVAAAREVASWGVTFVVVSLGADGMVGVCGGEVVYAHSEPVTVVNTIGAGDASLAGFLSHIVASPNDFPGAIGSAVAWGGAKVGQPTSQLSSVTSLPRVTVTTAGADDVALSEPGRLPQQSTKN
jgi:1-phosphofructokinase